MQGYWSKAIKKYIEIWTKNISLIIGIEFDSESIYGDSDKDIETKIRSYGGKINANFQGKKIPKENTSYKCLSLIRADSLIRLNKMYYPKTVLKECK